MTFFYLGVNNLLRRQKMAMPGDSAQTCSAELKIDLVQFSFDLLNPKTVEPALTSMIETVHPFEAEERQALKDLRTSIDYWRENL